MEMHPGSTAISKTIVEQSQIPCIIVYPLCTFIQELQSWGGELMHVTCFKNSTSSQKKSYISRREKGNFLCC